MNNLKRTNRNVLSQNAFWMVNKSVTRSLGDVRASLLLSYLVDKEAYHESQGGLVESEGELWFYATSDAIETELCLSYRQQKTVINILEGAGVVATKVMGLPAKTHFSIDQNKIAQMVNPSFSESAKLDAAEAQNNNNNRINNNRINNTVCLSKKSEAELIDIAFDGLNETGPKEKSSAKKEKEQDGPVTPETAARRDAVIAGMSGRPAHVDDRPMTAARSAEDATEQMMQEIETPEGARMLEFALGAAGMSKNDKDKINLFAAVYRCAQHQEKKRGTVPDDLWGKLPGYLRTQKRIDSKPQKTSYAKPSPQINDNPGGYDYDNLPDFNAKPVPA